ncbi:MAG: hypothetical protein V4673_03125, partial [Pseudomonadota bacterium]
SRLTEQRRPAQCCHPPVARNENVGATERDSAAADAPGQTQTVAPVAPPPGLAPARTADPGPQPVPLPESQSFKPPQPAPTGG